jgi:hypothetical protein
MTSGNKLIRLDEGRHALQVETIDGQTGGLCWASNIYGLNTTRLSRSIK